MSVQRSARPVTAYGRSLLSAADAATAMNSISPQTTKGDLIVEQGGSNVAASGGGASSSNGDGSLPAHAFNGVEGTDSVSPAGTGWRSNGNPAWLSNDLGSAQAIGSIRVLLGTGASRKFAGFALSWSDNNSTWTAVPGASIGAWAQDTTLNFTPITHRYWRLDFGNSSLGGDCIEWQIFSSLSAVRTAVATNGTVLQSDSTAARGVSYTHPKDPVKAGTPTDSDVISTAASGMGIVDTTGVKLWKRFGTTWTAVGPLDVTEVDGSPTSSSISKLVFPNDTVTISGSTATIRQVPQAFIGAKVYNSSTQSLAASTADIVTLYDSEEFDTDSFHDTGSNTGRMTVPTGLSGKYLLTAGGLHVNGSASSLFYFRKNGTTQLRAGLNVGPTNSVNMRQDLSAVLDLVAGDYVELLITTGAGASQTWGHASNANAQAFFSIVKLDSGTVGAGIGASAYRSTTQGSLAATTENSIILNGAEVFDTDAFHDLSTNPARFTVPAGLGGKYLCIGRASVSVAFYLGFKKNGTGVTDTVGPYSANFVGVVSVVLDLVAGDYVELFEYHSTGTGTVAATNVTDRPTVEFMRLDSGSVGGSSAPGYEFDYAAFTSAVNITATTEATANSIVSANAVNFDGSTTVTVEFFAPTAVPQATNGIHLIFYLYDGSSSVGILGQITHPGSSQLRQPVVLRHRLTPSAGAHTYSIRATTGSGTGVVTGGAGGAAAYMPGFIRITRA